MTTLVINTNKSHAVHEWIMKEWGSYEDHDKSETHVVAILEQFGKRLRLTEQQAKTLIESGEYQSTSWQPDEISGGQRTMNVIARYVRKLKTLLNNNS